jgi:NitT/TauT family transport system ATP-binding protein
MAAVILDVTIRRKAYPGAREPVLADLSFRLGENEIVAVVGPSGCGKTTLLRLIADLDQGYEGKILWPGQKGRPRLGFVFQEPRLLPWRTVWENLALVLPPGQEGAAEALLRRLGLWAACNAYPNQISLGMARRVAIARAFAIAPALVLLDEPFASLDAGNAELARAVLREAWEARPTAALLVTHDLTDAAALADRVLMLAGHPSHISADIIIPSHKRRGDRETIQTVAAHLRECQEKGAISAS